MYSDSNFCSTYFSPFARKAKEYNYRFRGGKSDDITVLVGQVKTAPEATQTN